MKAKAVLAVAVLLAMAFVCFAPADDSDAANQFDIKLKDGSSYTVSEGRALTITLVYTLTDRNHTSNIDIYLASDPSNPVYSERYTFQVDSSGSTEKTITFTPAKAGSMYIKFSNEDVHDNINFTVSFSTSIWSNWTTYLVIIVVIILIVALVVFKSRMAPKQKNQLTFEQIEAQRQSQKAAPKEERKAPVKSERQRYLESKKK